MREKKGGFRDETGAFPHRGRSPQDSEGARGGPGEVRDRRSPRWGCPHVPIRPLSACPARGCPALGRAASLGGEPKRARNLRYCSSSSSTTTSRKTATRAAKGYGRGRGRLKRGEACERRRCHPPLPRPTASSRLADGQGGRRSPCIANSPPPVAGRRSLRTRRRRRLS